MLKNCTPHLIRAVGPDGVTREYPPSGEVARVATSETPAGTLDGLPAVRRTFGEVHLPPADVDPGDGGEAGRDYLIVSSLVLEALRAEGLGRHDGCVAPDTGPTAVRKDGQVFAVTRWVR